MEINMRKMMFAMLGACLVVNGVSVAMDNGVGVDVSMDFNSKYIWRVQKLNDDAVFQPGISVTFDKFTAGIWGNVDTTDYTGNSGEFTEYDYSLDYTTSVADGIDLSLGVINYYFPGIPSTTELYWGFSFDLPLSPSVTVYHDVDAINGTYVSCGVSHSVEKIAELSSDMPIGMEIGTSLGWGSTSYNTDYWGTPATSSGLNDLTVGLSFPVTVGKWTVSPSVNYVTLVDSDVRKSDAFDTSSDYFFTGISLSTSF